MNKRKIVLLAVALCMAAILGMGSTLAYLTDTETKANIFTVGNVDITLNEVFDENKLIPGIDVQKEITVTNVGSEEAYVRVHFAIPALLDSGDPDFLAYANMLHFNFGLNSMAPGEWSWFEKYEQISKTPDSDGDVGYPGNGGAWNTYTANVDGIEYNVYVGTWMTPLAPNGNGTTEVAIRKVYLDPALDNVHVEEIIKELKEIKVLVAAEAVQAAGFKNAYEAFDAAHTNFSDIGKDWQNLPDNLIEHVYEENVQPKVSTETNAVDEK